VWGANYSALCYDLFFVILGVLMRKDIRQLFEEFIYECEFVRKVRPETIRGYIQSYKTFIKLMPDVSTDQIHTSTIINFFKILQERKRIVGKGTIKTGIKKSTAASYWCKLNVFFEWLTLKGQIKENPFTGMKYPTPSYEDKKYLCKEEIEKILTAIHTHHHENILLFKRNLALFYLLLFCGLRKEELLLLQIRDIDFERKLVHIRNETSKSGRSRQLPIHSSTLMHLKDYLKERNQYTTPYIIVSNKRDDKLTYDGLKHLVNKIRKASGVPFHLHQFRHTFAVNFLRSTNNIFKLRTLLGHKDIRVTTLYLRCLPPEELRGDIETLNIDNFI
jgi:integrase/recombinase XerD